MFGKVSMQNKLSPQETSTPFLCHGQRSTLYLFQKAALPIAKPFYSDVQFDVWIFATSNDILDRDRLIRDRIFLGDTFPKRSISFRTFTLPRDINKITFTIVEK